MTVALAFRTPINLSIGGSTVAFGFGESTNLSAANASASAASASAAALSEAMAEALVGPAYASTAAGIAATTSGAYFAVDAGGGIVTIYKNVSGSAVFQRSQATTAALAASTGAALIGTTGSRTQADKNADTVSVFDGFIPQSEFAAILAGTTTYDASADIADAIAAVDGTGKTLLFPGGTYLVSTVTFTGSDYSVETNGCLFKQIAGTVGDVLGAPAVVRFISAENVTCGDFRVQGNIATDTGENNHGAGIASCKNVRVGSIYAVDPRGDALYCYARNTSDAERQSGVYVASVSGSNVYRNLLSVLGGQIHVGAVIHDGPVGFRDFDVEPNDASGSYEAVDLQIDYAKIGSADITSDDAAVINNSVRIGTLDADLGRVAATTPAYPTAPGSGAYALGVTRVHTVQIGHFKARNYNGYAVSLGTDWSSLDIGTLDIADCSLTDTTYNTMILQQGDAGLGMVRIGTLICDAANTKYLARVALTGSLKIEVNNIALMKCLIGVQITGRFANGLIDINSSTGVALATSDSVVFHNVTTANHASATFTSGCSNIVAINSPMFGGPSGLNLVVGGSFYIAGTKVIGNQGASLPADATDLATAITLANAIKARLKATGGHGLVAD